MTSNNSSDNLETQKPANDSPTTSKKTIVIGIAAAMLTSICYGFVPFFIQPMRNEQSADFMADSTILFYRFGIAALVVALAMVVQRKSFKITRGELVTLIYLSFVSDGAALFLIDSYNYMATGVATTLHFLYPMMTAVIMMIFYNEARRMSTLLAVLMAVAGVGIFSWSPSGSIGFKGILIALISDLCFALYLIHVNRSKAATMDGTKLVFYVLFIGALIFGGEALRQGNFAPITTFTQSKQILALAVISTLVTNVGLVVAVKRIGSTMTSVMGALEPLTAVVIGCIAFNEQITWQVVLGIALILPAVILIIITRRK